MKTQISTKECALFPLALWSFLALAPKNNIHQSINQSRTPETAPADTQTSDVPDKAASPTKQ